jgi:ABC-type phosphate transport system substrate-binding protein
MPHHPVSVVLGMVEEIRTRGPGRQAALHTDGLGARHRRVPRGKADFVATDETLTPQQLQSARQKSGADILQVPMVLSAVVPIYNVGD